MQNTQANSLTRTGFWLFAALLGLFAAAKVALYDSLDPDCFWHLRVAAQLRHDGIGPIVDELSFASIRQPWTPYSWLAELGMKGIWDLGGFRAAVAVTAASEALIVVLLALCCLQVQRAPRYLATVAATAAGEFLILPYLSFRPVTFAFVLLFGIAYLLLRDRKFHVEHRPSSSAVWLSIPLTVILTNIHLFSFLVPGMTLALAIGAAVEGDGKYARRLSILASATAVACLATPMLPGLLKTIFFYSAQDRMVRGPVIAEMQSFFRGPVGWICAVGLIAMLLCIVRRWRIIGLGHLLCIAAASLLLLQLGRFAPIFALAACPALAATLPPIKDRLLGKPAIVLVLASVLVMGSARFIRAFPNRSTTVSQWVNRHGPDFPGYPCEAADFVDRAVYRQSGHLINEFNWGGYLAWRLDGKFQVLLDGRTQVFPAALWQSTYLGSDVERRQFLATLRADAALLPAKKSMFRESLIQLGWTQAYKDDRAEVLLPPGAVARIE